MKPELDRPTREAFDLALSSLANVPFVIAGAFALNHHTGIWRFTKDLDIFCEPERADEALGALGAAGFRTYIEEKHWLGKAVLSDALVDVIWGGGNWATFVDRLWLTNARRGDLLDHQPLFASPEDIILSKAYVAGRERFDGTDIAHLIHACGTRMDWTALLARFGDHWPLLLHYIVLFRFVYPKERDIVPARLVHELAARIGTDDEARDGLSFRGPLLDRYGYLHDLSAEGREDPRETLAARAGLPIGDVTRRRRLDQEALDSGRVYRAETENQGEYEHGVRPCPHCGAS